MRIALAWMGLALAAAPALAAKTDVVVLRNGDHVTCEVDQLERGQLIVKTDDMGTLEIEWDKVRSVTAAAQFDVEDLEGGRYVGSLQPTPGADGLRITSAAGASVLPIGEVASVHRLGATFWNRLDGSLDVGTSYTSASELFDLDLSATIGTYKPAYELSASGSATVTTQTGAEDSSRSVLSLAYGKHLPGRWVVLGKGQLEENSELGFDLRSSFTAGGGRYFVQRRGDRLLAGVGLSVNREKPVEGESTTNLELTALVAYDRFAYDFPKVDLSVSAAGFTSLSDPRYRFELDARLKRELVKDFYATLRGYESYDSRPPTEDGAATNDWGMTFALGWSF